MPVVAVELAGLITSRVCFVCGADDKPQAQNKYTTGKDKPSSQSNEKPNSGTHEKRKSSIGGGGGGGKSSLGDAGTPTNKNVKDIKASAGASSRRPSLDNLKV
jgi:hypothetical protein